MLEVAYKQLRFTNLSSKPNDLKCREEIKSRPRQKFDLVKNRNCKKDVKVCLQMTVKWLK